MDVVAEVTRLFRRHPSVTEVRLVGSRAHGTATPLSDWDFRVDGSDLDRLITDLPELVRPLRPLAAQWDRLSDRAVFMLILPGAIKVDIFPGDLPHPEEGPWQPDATNLEEIDAHFWDWMLWLGAKQLAGQEALVKAELQKLFDMLLGPLGDTDRQSTIPAAVASFMELRQQQETELGVSVDQTLGRAVRARLAELDIR